MADQPDDIAALDAALLAALQARLAAEARREPPPPDQAAIELRAVLGRARVAPAVVLEVWRAVAGRAQPVAVWGAAGLARRRFGPAARLTPAATPEAALAAARKGGAAVLALDPREPWWGRLLAMPELQVFAALPELAAEGPVTALAVARVRPEPSGGDQTFWVTDAPQSAAALEEALGRDGLAARLVLAAGGLKLFALAGYVQGDDARLARAPGRLSGVIGAAPAPFDV